MQYILSEDEMAEVVLIRKELKRLPSVALLQKECTRIADTVPTFKGWDGKSEAEPWGCILSVDYEDHYCDECPVQKICPREYKSWSK